MKRKNGLRLSLLGVFIVIGCQTLPHAARSASNWVGLDLNYSQYEKYRHFVEQKTGLTLKHRGEAHITLITPPEFKNQFQSIIDLQQLENLRDSQQESLKNFKELCIGRAEKRIDGKIESTWFVVVEGEGLLNYRQAANDLLKKKKASVQSEAFARSSWNPHITLGFTLRDLHDSDGIVKNSSQCVYQLPLTP